MIQSIRPLLQTSSEEVEFGRMQISGGRIDPQRVPGPGRRNYLGSANRCGMKQKLRKKTGSVNRRLIGRKVKNGNAFVMAKRIRQVRPIQKVPRPPQRFSAVLSKIVVFAPSAQAVPSSEVTQRNRKKMVAAKRTAEGQN